MDYIIQSVRFPQSKWTEKQANWWIKSHGFKTIWRGKKVDISHLQYRFRQKDPNIKHKSVKTIRLPNSNGIQYVIYYL
jgi:hypothetical protein